ncbi:MAG: hypothetical protein ACE5MI_00650 [Acidimicrobiia bacterium]
MAVLHRTEVRQAEASYLGAGAASVGWTLSGLGRSLLTAAALTVGAELLLHRLAPPVLSQVVPGSSLNVTVASAGELAASSGAVLVFAAAVALALKTRRLGPPLLGAAGTVLLASIWTAPVTGVLVHTAVAAAAAAVGIAAVRRRQDLYSTAVVMAALAVVVSHLSLLVDAAWPSRAVSSAVAARGIAELLIVSAALILAASLLAEGSPGLWVWTVAAGSAIVVAGALTFQPGFAAIGAIWALGATLSLPPLLYIAAAGAIGLLVAGWSASPATRPLAAAVVLFGTAGIQSQVLHHDLTAIVALSVLAGTIGGKTISGEET